MKKIFCFIIFAFYFTVNPCMAYKVCYEKSDSIKVENLLADAIKQKEGTDYIIYFARRLRGIPYVAHTLEVNNTEQLVINMRQLDCTTYVENVVALYLCMRQKAYSFKDFCANIRRLRYRGGAAPHYVKRLHYFTDWIEDNTAKGICREIQEPIPPFTAVQKINVGYMSANPGKYKMLRENPEYLPDIALSEKGINGKSYRYIPKSEVKNTALLRKTVSDGDILAITTTLNGLDIQHIGFAVWHKDGLHLLNASSIHHKVVEEPMTLYNYLQKKKSMTGIRVISVLH